MKDVDTMYVIEVGDLVWQSRQPGGWCVVLEVTEWVKRHQRREGWLSSDYPIYKVHHPTEGIIQDASYYYHTAEEHNELINRVWKDGKVVGYKEGYDGPRRFKDESG